DGTEDELLQGHGAGGEVAADEVGVVALEIRRREAVAADDAVAEPGREALDLGLDALGGVLGRAVGHVAVGPDGVEAGRRAGRVEEAGLGKDEKRALRDAPVPGRRLGGGDLVQGPPDVEGARAAGLFGEPRDGAGQGPVQLEGARAVAEAREAAAVALGQPGAGEREELAWRDV